MADYVPIELVDEFLSSSEVIKPEVDKFHLQLSTNVLNFTKYNEAKEIILTNIGWDNLPFEGLNLTGEGFVVQHNLPSLLLRDRSYSLTVLQTGAIGTRLGGLFINVGNSYGNKYVVINDTVS